MALSKFTKLRYFLEDHGFPEDYAFIMARTIPLAYHAFIYKAKLPSRMVDSSCTWNRTSWEPPYYYPPDEYSVFPPDKADTKAELFWVELHACAVELLDPHPQYHNILSNPSVYTWSMPVKKKPARILNA